jgi:hypothetical protein
MKEHSLLFEEGTFLAVFKNALHDVAHLIELVAFSRPASVCASNSTTGATP